MEIRISRFPSVAYRMMSGTATKIANDKTMQAETRIIFLPCFVSVNLFDPFAEEFFLDLRIFNRM